MITDQAAMPALAQQWLWPLTCNFRVTTHFPSVTVNLPDCRQGVLKEGSMYCQTVPGNFDLEEKSWAKHWPARLDIYKLSIDLNFLAIFYCS